jgi:ethanolamine utilization protein EutQ
MPTLIAKATRITAAGNKPKLIDEYVGRVNTKNSSASIAHMRSPAGWMETGQTPEFDEFTIVLKAQCALNTRTGCSTFLPDRESSHTLESGCDTQRLTRAAQNT